MKQILLLIAVYFLCSSLSGQCTALFTWDDTNITIQFMDLSTSSPGNPIVSWSWDFDDGGNTSLQQNPIYTFSEPDKYDVVLTITTQDGCSSSIEIEIETCVLAVSHTIGTCNSEGNIPVTLFVSDIYDNADDIDIILNGSSIPGSPFPIDADNPVSVTVFVPGNGLAHVIQIQSTDIATCGKVLEFTVPDCNSNCFLSSLQVGYPAGTTHTVDVGDDFFSPVSTGIILGDVVNFNWIGDGHSTTSDATSGADAWNSGVISIGSSYDLTIQNPGVHPYYCIPHGSTGGVGMSGEILANCPTGDNLDLEINFNTSIADPQGYNVYYDAVLVPGSPFSYNGIGTQTVTISIAGDGNTHPLLIEDVNDPSCTLSLNYDTPDCGQGGGDPVCNISVNTGDPSGCDANQNISIDATILIANGGTGFDLSIDGNSSTFYSYDGSNTTITLSLPGDGQSHSITVTDNVDATCTATSNVITPNCNLPCDITNLVAVAGGGGGGGIIHTVDVEDNIFNPSIVNITVGDQVEWIWTGAVLHTVSSDDPNGPESFESGLQGNGSTFLSPVLSEGEHPYYCMPHGLPGGIGMAGTVFVLPPCNAAGEVMVTIDFEIISNGINGYEVFVDGNSSGIFPYAGGNAQTATFNVAGDNMSHTIEVKDVDDPNCSASTTLVTPDCNGGGTPECMIDVSGEVTGGCNTSNEVPVEFTVTASDQGDNFSVLVDGNNEGTYTYTGSTTVVIIDIPGDGQSHTVTVTDNVDPLCTSTIDITTPNCTLPCSITNFSAAASGGGGGGIIHTVEVEDNIFNPSIVNITVGDQVEWIWTGAILHTVSSDNPSGPESFESGLQGNGSSFLSPVLSEGEHPYYCMPHGLPGGIGMAGTVFVLPPCNAAGEVIVNLSFEITSNGSNGYEVFVDGLSKGIYSYVSGALQTATINVAGDNMSHTIEVYDVDDPSCSASTTLVTPDCNGGGTLECTIDVSGEVTGGCNTSNEVPVEFTVTASDQGDNFSVLVDGNNEGTYAYTGSTTVVIIDIPGDGQSHTVTVTDNVDPLCTATVDILTPNCLSDCNIVSIDLTFGESQKHIIQVEDNKFTPDSITITLGDTVLFDWTGDILHTATSDVQNLPNSFNSDLLPNGSMFQIIPSEAGNLPYYCVPHGLPGGIGMAGNILINSACNGEDALATISVTSEGSSGDGFSLALDGNILPESPLPFDPSGISTGTIVIPGDNLNHVLTVADFSEASCADSITFESPLCILDQCQTTIDSVLFDDCVGALVDMTINFTSTETESPFNIYLNGFLVTETPVNTDEQGVGTFSTEISGLGIGLEVLVTSTTISCLDMDLVFSPDCEVTCILSDVILGNGLKKHQVEVRDNDFLPQYIEVLLGDTVDFVWTGEVPHTSTSDASTGEDSWESGLLGQGEIFELVIPNAGIHPYYCKPHGGPNGIGMAGVINVIDTCDGENWLTNYSFNVTAGSPFGYNIFIDGMLWNDSPILYSDPTGLNSGVLSLPGDNMTYFVTFQDVETNFCAFTESVTTGQCGASCIIDELVVKTGEDVIHEIEVRDYDFLPAEITARAGETVRFIWTGDVPHTSTSDLVSGIDSWESGLLSKGDTFDLVLQTPGDHPFYCKPHGGPGGIGQAGVISILPQCEDGQEELTICFDAKGGSTEGYRLFIDGNIVGDLQDYENSNGANSISVLLPADGLQHIITIQDDQDSICAASINYYADDCTLDCEMGGLSYELISTSHTVLVLDNEYLPVEIDVEAGDTINFVWEGLIPHTVTSDSISTNTGNAFFNSGLLQQGAQWNLILNETGEYPYYCVPHGGPGGVGMAGSISVSEPCEDEQTLAQFTFVTSKLAGTYDVILNGSEVLSNVPYTGVPQNTFVLTLPADNTELNIMVIDGNDPLCTISLIIDGIDCNDPCFDTEASYDYNIDFTTMNVTFNSTSSGDIVSWMWDFGDGNFSEEENPNHTFLDPLVYEVCLTVTDDQDCVDTICDKVRFSNEVCIAGFDYIQNDLDFIFLNTSDYEDPETEILWTFDDGSLSTLTDSVAHTFELGIYTVCIEITSDSCSATYCEQIDLSDPCLLITPNFIADVDEPNLTVNFTDLSTGEPDTWLWGFGDGTTSPEQNPSHTYDSFGDYNVCLFVQQSDESCSKSICRKISVGITGVVEIEKFKTLTIYPNPSQVTSDIFVKGFNSKDLGKGAKVAIRNSAGIAISEYTIVLEETIAIELQDLPGIYMINVTAENFSYQSLFIRL